MKLNGQVVKGRNRVVIAIPRPTREEGDLIFIAEAVEGYGPFERLVKEPKPPAKVKPDKTTIYDYNDQSYIIQLGLYNKKRIGWLILESLKATPGLEWDTVNMADPETYPNWERELKAADLNQFEVNRVLNGVFEANCLNEGLVQAARESFLRGMEEERRKSSGQSTEQESTPSGEPANG